MDEGKDGVLQCTVIKSYPKVTQLVFLPDGENVNIIKVNDTSIKVMITKANMNNSINYTCFASTGRTQAFLTYQNFVGGKNFYNVMIIIINNTFGKQNNFCSEYFWPCRRYC